MKRGESFGAVFLKGAGELLRAFALGLLVVGIVSNMLYDLLTAPPALSTVLGPVVVSAALTVVAYWLYQRDQRRRRLVIRANVDESRLVPAFDGLILLLGPNFRSVLPATEHHHAGGGAKHCWLIMQNQPPVRNAYEQLVQAVPDGDTRLHPVFIDRLEAREAYQAVRAIFDIEAEKRGLTASQVIADITGGTKPLTAGTPGSVGATPGTSFVTCANKATRSTSTLAKPR